MRENLFGQKIKEARGKTSQEEAATAIERLYGVRLSPSYLSMIENGSRTNLTTKLINALLSYFKLPPETSSLLHGSEEFAPMSNEDVNFVRISSPDIRRIARAGEKMTPEKRAKLLQVAQTIFPEAFENDNEEH